jgi:bacillithiol synthase
MEQTADIDCTHRIPFAEAPHISKLIKTYLAGKLPSDCYYRTPDIAGLQAQAREKLEHFPEMHRKALVNALHRQYARCNIEIAGKTTVLENIDLLSKKNTVTITTGHQLCLAGGPLYSFYKIISTIATCRVMQAHQPDTNFVPVFWMASEDHDREEINHFYFHGEKWVWEKESKGAVGRFSTEGLTPFLDVFEKRLPEGEVAGEIVKHLRYAYGKHTNLADATRQWVHDIFGVCGLVVLDADDAELKAQMMLPVEEELFGKGISNAVEQYSAVLEKNGFSAQARPAAINIFYLGDGDRVYIEKTENGFRAGERTFTVEEMRKTMQSNPEHFSPNVILRPVYQEIILPNIAYCGGPGELAYWFQLKGVFDRLSIPFPVLLLRHGFALLDEKNLRRYEKLNTNLIFRAPKDWKAAWVKANSHLRLELTQEKKKITEIFDNLSVAAKQTDSSMEGAVNAQRAKQLKGLEKLEKKLLRAEKRHYTETMAHIDALLNVLYPCGIPQERFDSLWQWWMAFGKNPIPAILQLAESDIPAGNFLVVSHQFVLPHPHP